MRMKSLLLVGAAVLTATMWFAPDARAVAALRTFVASTGNDANVATNCPRTNPCRNFVAAYGVTGSGGEVVALDAAGYGVLNVSTAVTISAPPGVSAFIQVPSSSTGIAVNAGASDLVVIRNIVLIGSGAASSIGISHTSGKLVVENCTFSQLTTGLASTAKADVLNSQFWGNTTGLEVTGAGADFNVFPIVCTTACVRLVGGSFTANTTALSSINPGSNKNNILEWITSNTSAAFSTHFAGNTTYFSGTGTGCPCSGIGNYSSTTNPK